MNSELILAVTLSFTNMSLARWNDSGFKSSPLFKHALNNAIDRLEGKTNDVSDGDKPTSKAGCSDPKAENTLRPICNTSEMTCEGSYTCVNYPTCMGGNTCYSTCASTCSGNTCGATCEETCTGNTCDNTCAGGVCPYHYIWRGRNYWHYDDNYNFNWNQLTWGPGTYKQNPGTTYIKFTGSNPPATESDHWNIWEGYYNINKWYSDAITNHYDVESHILMRAFYGDPWTDYIAVTHVHSPPDATGYYTNVHYYFSD